MESNIRKELLKTLLISAFKKTIEYAIKILRGIRTMRILVDGNILRNPPCGIKNATEGILNELHKMSSIKISYFNIHAKNFPEKLQNKYNINFSNHVTSETVVWAPTHRITRRFDRSTPIVLTVHDLVWKIVPSTMKLTTFIGENLFFPSSVARANYIACVSKNTEKDLHKFFPLTKLKTRVVYLASKPNLAKPEYKNKPFALFLGTFEPRKNLKTLMAAISKLSPSFLERMDFVIAGNKGWGNIDIEKLRKKYKLEKSVKIIYSPSDDEIQKLFIDCKFLMFPSYYEGFGLPVIEALSAGKPVLVSNTSSLPEIAGAAGLYVDPTDEKSIVIALNELIGNSKLYNSLKEQTNYQASKFTWQKSADKMVEIFVKSLQKKGL